MVELMAQQQYINILKQNGIWNDIIHLSYD